MKCSQCGVKIPEGTEFCPACAEKIAQDKKPVNIFQKFKLIKKTAINSGAKIKRTKLVLIICASAVVVLCAVLIPVLLENARANQYKEAFSLLDSGEVGAAQEEFIELGNYQQAAKKVDDCQNILDYDAAGAMMDDGEYASARETFIQLGDYKNSSGLADQCQNTIDYNEAVLMMDTDDNEKARDVFLALEDFEDSKELAKECQKRLDYDAAKALMDNADYEAAVSAFKTLGDYQDAADLKLECENIIDYDLAEKAFSEGKFYSAFVLFDNMDEQSGYKDSGERADACLQTPPKSSEIFRNEEYRARGCSLYIHAPKEDGDPYTLMKIYTDNDVLVSTVFIKAGEKVKIKLPSGSYKFKQANGYLWFGQEEMFGDIGYYEVWIFEENSEIKRISSSYYYTLTLVVANVNDGARQLDYEDF